MKYYPTYFVIEIVNLLTSYYPRGWALVSSLFAMTEDLLVDIFVKDAKLWYRLKRLLEFCDDKLSGSTNIKITDIDLKRVLTDYVVFREFWSAWTKYENCTSSPMDYLTYVEWKTASGPKKNQKRPSPELKQLDLDF
jgi:hypothetical protein